MFVGKTNEDLLRLRDKVEGYFTACNWIYLFNA